MQIIGNKEHARLSNSAQSNQPGCSPEDFEGQHPLGDQDLSSLV
jgi:hypothetical protein